MTKIYELLTKEELLALSKANEKFDTADWRLPIKDLTVQQLSYMALTILATEYGDKCPDCLLPAKALEILVERAKVKGLPIF